MLIKVLMETLGITKNQIAERLHHVIYDRLYCTNEKWQTDGGLKLRDKLSKQLESIWKYHGKP